MNVLVTGGAGYIGSVLAEQLLSDGHAVVILDNLQQGHQEAVFPEATFVRGDLGDKEVVGNILRQHGVETVIHLGAETVVVDSIGDPGRYFRNNIVNSINLLDTMLQYGVSKIVSASSAAVYGQPESLPVTEMELPRPVSAYGESTLMFERVLWWYWRAHGIKSVAFRFFNVAGASERFGEDHTPVTTIIPIILKTALGQRDCVYVFGSDYETRDGSCIRDYIHVEDIARAHILAMKEVDRLGYRVYNLGGCGDASVLEVIEMARKVTGKEIPAQTVDRRAGDPAMLFASSELAASELGWHPERSELRTIIESAWRWQERHPSGYTG